MNKTHFDALYIENKLNSNLFRIFKLFNHKLSF